MSQENDTEMDSPYPFSTKPRRIVRYHFSLSWAMTRSAKPREPSRSHASASSAPQVRQVRRRDLLCVAADKTVKGHRRTSSVRTSKRLVRGMNAKISATCCSFQPTQALEARFPGGAVRHFAVAEKGAQAIENAASASRMKTPSQRPRRSRRASTGDSWRPNFASWETARREPPSPLLRLRKTFTPSSSANC